MQITSYKLQVASLLFYLLLAARYLLLPFLLLTAYCLLPASALADEPIDISAEHLEYLAETNTYIAKGLVKIILKDITLNADVIQFNDVTDDALAIGNVIYEDTEVIIRADKIELNLDTKLGVIYNSDILYKSRNYHIEGKTIKKVGDKTYFIDEVSATTCDSTPPPWHFTAEDVKILLHENIKANNATFYIKNVPVIIIPQFRAPLVKERQSGFLLPNLGYNNKKGFVFNQAFFWAMKDNMDATFYADYFSEKGIGKGVDYRYILAPKTIGELWAYHIRDNDSSRDLLELKSYHNQKLPYNMTGRLRIHFVNESDYYHILESTSSGRIGFSEMWTDPFGFASEERLQKYLESNLQISKPLLGGRAYLLGQFRESLEEDSETIPQSLPEIGFVTNSRSLSKIFFNLSVTGINFRREEGKQWKRLDINPNLYLSFGRILNLTQKIGLRETVYFPDDSKENPHRELFDTRTILTTRLLKEYPSVIHIIEPSVEYIYIPHYEDSRIPIFDSIDSISRRSDIAYALTNRFTGTVLGGTEARLRLSQSYSLLDVDKPFSPALLEVTLSSGSVNLSANASYDVYEESIPETFASISLRGRKGFVGIGKNMRKLTSVDQYFIEAGLNRPLKMLDKSIPMDIAGSLLYDVKGDEVQESGIKTTYTHQCWGLTIFYKKRPFEYQIMFGIEFKGFGMIRIG